MRLSKKIIPLIAAVLAFAMLVPGALAAGSIGAEAGKTATVTFTFQDIYNVDGAFAVSDPQKILSTYSINVADGGATTALVNGDRLWASPSAQPVKTTVSVTVTLSIKSSAAAGSACTVTFTGIYGDANEEPGNEHDITRTATVTVQASGGGTVTPGPTPTVDPTPVPSDEPSGSGVDYSELRKQITIADGLILSDYTDESRRQLTDALNAAKQALSSEDQAKVTAAADKLRKTVAGMVSMNYADLKAALTRADALLASEQAAALLQELSEAAQRGSELLGSGDQQAVDQATSELTDIMNRLAALLETDGETKVVIQEVPVEVPPEGDYCNIPVHHVWPVLFWVSLAVNVVLLGGIAFFMIRRTRNRKDYAPMVDYDIDEDI